MYIKVIKDIYCRNYCGEQLELPASLENIDIPELPLNLSIEIDTHPNCLEILIGR